MGTRYWNVDRLVSYLPFGFVLFHNFDNFSINFIDSRNKNQHTSCDTNTHSYLYAIDPWFVLRKFDGFYFSKIETLIVTVTVTVIR